jgi:hypothetical protein
MFKFVFLYVISLSVMAQNITVEQFYLTPLGPDVGILLKNNSDGDIRFNTTFIPQKCKRLGIDTLNIVSSMSSIDSTGFVASGGFMAAYYSLQAADYAVPCVVKVFIGTIDSSNESRMFEKSVRVDIAELRMAEGSYGETAKLTINYSLKKMNNSHLEFTLLLENPTAQPNFVEMTDIKSHCDKGNLTYKRTGNYPDGISNGRGVIFPNSWRAYKFIFKRDPVVLSCAINVMLTDINGIELHRTFKLDITD